MPFDVGDKVVYPHHGAAVVERNTRCSRTPPKIRSYQIAEVVRSLPIRDKDKGLSAGEQGMLTRARQILVSELTFAIGMSEEEAEKKLEAALP